MRVSVRDAAMVCGWRSPSQLYRLLSEGKLSDYAHRSSDGTALLELNPGGGIAPLVEVVNNLTRRQMNRNAPRKRTRQQSDLPSFDESRQRCEYERARILELQRIETQEALIDAESATATWAQIVRVSRARIESIPAAVGAKVPRLSAEDLQIIGGLIAEALEDLK